ncbi:MAG: helix-turn-helix domain-containing protein [Candidatus Marinimicrobia bacterium]|jgi:excisionase family DNA binding protein|nr:helix-turn-helix domain-containing protein [Candidatus Neomarinimicrobiota bacterium]MBT3633397.1 helix-turn-helix domain-containing protein [Candidatus Neomarinimicrobiota bacterium]MBT3681540.1 helix-turn-helix domain-containing protein [Candidatus Neomarinimicrobiota bacterium]MBT3758493.1 helix-turn-helix domain-containing protein [Candidatus Neomarinimicrobiota bacterium]MBT3894853.1 helix-turn-helix domain-containing protein [Candidatus Neomarinimicrobiota bacterium]
MNDIMNIKDVSNYLKLKEQTVYRLLKGGKLPGLKVGGTWMVKKSHLDKMFSDVLNEKLKNTKIK